MRVWGKRNVDCSPGRGIARAAAEGATRGELISEAVCFLLAHSGADRIGVWMELKDRHAHQTSALIEFRGMVADANGYATPSEWSKLAPEVHLPKELLVNGRASEQELSSHATAPVMGALLEIQRALWVPIAESGGLRGVLLAGVQKKNSVLSRALVESVASELALALALERQQDIAQQRSSDIDAASRTLAATEATLAAAEALCKKHEEEAANLNTWQRRVLEASDQAAIFVSSGGDIVTHTKAAERLLATSVPANLAQTARQERKGDFIQRFPASEQDRVRDWWQRITVCAHNIKDEAAEPLMATLANGVRVRMGTIPAPPGGLMAVTFEALQTHPETLAVHGSDSELLNVLEWLEEGVVLFGPRQEIRAMNSRFAQMAGVTPQERGRITNLNTLIAEVASNAAEPERFAQHWQELASTAEGGTREELQMVRPAPRVLERASRPMVDSAGEVLGRVEIYRDLTTQRLFHSKLLQTEKLAVIGQMVSGIAHELSSPLTSILGYAQRLLLRGEPVPKAAEAQQIFQEAERATTILRQLLHSARESEPVRRRVSLNQIVSRAMELQRFGLASERVTVALDLDSAPPFVHGDAGQLQQVVMNLILNARQAIEEYAQHGTIRVRTKRVDDRWAVLEVSDNGPGIPPEILARIFDPFFTTKPAGIGTGLGLAVVLGIVREHGGHVHVKSPPGEGATFSIELPAAAAVNVHVPDRAPQALVQKQPERLPSSEPLEVAHAGFPLASWAGLRVLVVEDEPTVAHLIEDVLEDVGLHVNVMLGGREALQHASRENYELVICDMKMPDVDGRSFYDAIIRRRSELRKRFLFVTGDVLAAHTREFLERNNLPHVAKPFRVEELMEQIQLVLERISPRKATPAHVARTKVARK